MAQKKNDHLVDVHYGIKDLVNIERLSRIFEMFTSATGFPIGFFDHPDKNQLFSTGWRELCSKYHRVCPISAQNCLKSNTRLFDQLSESGKIVIDECDNGLVDCATPIIIRGRHLASVVTGQLFLKAPDLQRFKRQARTFGINEKQYLDALKKIPVVSKRRFKSITGLLVEIACVISEMGYTKLEAKEEYLKLTQQILHRERIEKDLRESEEREHFALEASNMGTWDLNLVDHKAIRSIKHDQIFGYTELLPSWTYDIFLKHVLPEDRDLVDRKFRYALQNKSDLTFECRIRRVDGVVRWIFVVGRHKLGASGTLQRMVGVVQDITYRKVAQEELENHRYHLEELVKERASQLVTAREFLDQIINNIASPIFVKDKDHRWILLNDSYCEFMGYNKEDLIGKSDIDFFPPEQAEVFWQKDQLVFDSGQINVNEEKFTDAKGQVHTIVTKKVLFVQENTKEKVLVGIINDITELKNNEQRILQLNDKLQDSNIKLKNAYDQLQETLDMLVRSERMAALGEMAAMVGHELRNSLGVIRNSVYFLKSKLPKISQEKKILKYLDILEGEVRISDKVISDILSFNRIKPPVLQKENINAIIVEELKKIKFPIGVRKELYLDQSLALVEIDADQMRRVFINLIDNALDAMPDGGELLVKTFWQDPWFVVIFKDMGMGIPHENLNKIFKPGFTTKQHGSGLGLAICSSIVALHHGKIEVISQVGKGTEFNIYLPQLSSKEKQHAAQN
ncbi:MAG: PocR ligand-binding domain-containing protein [Candidatus Omnitrophica bacterium]|nr:PocR ligand-binding domain-containing protein [Candidatus Omnitrophota bacterium]